MEMATLVLRKGETLGAEISKSSPDDGADIDDSPGIIRTKKMPISEFCEALSSVLEKVVIDETGLQGDFNVNFQWKMSGAELLRQTMDRDLFRFVFYPDRYPNVSEETKKLARILTTGEPAAELDSLSDALQQQSKIYLTEMAKPERERFKPDIRIITKSLKEQLGLELVTTRKVQRVLVVEKASN